MSPGELAVVCARFDIGRITAVGPLALGQGVRAKVLIETDRGKYVLKRHATRERDTVAVSHEVVLRLEAEGLPVAPLVGTREGNAALTEHGPWVYELMGFVEGDRPSGSVEDSDLAGEALGRVHEALRGWRPARALAEEGYHSTPRVRSALRRCGQAHGRALGDDLAARYERAAAAVEKAGVKTWAREPMHGDWHPGNVVLRDGRSLSARAGIVLSAGSIESPMILMRSGIGPGADLKAAGIMVQVDAPGVGANLHDHPGFGLHFKGAGSGYGLTLGQLPAWALSPFQWLLTRSGRLSSNTVEAGAFYNVSGGDAPDIQTHFLPFLMGWQGRAIIWGAGYFADVCLCQPRSRGRLSMGRDPFAPLIDLNLFGDAQDLDTMVKGVTRLRQILATADFGTRRAPEAFPAATVTGDALREVIRTRAGTAYHPVGTVALGGPLDANGAVKGTQNLWVADASVMPRITTANTNAPSMMIGWQIGGHVAARAERTAA